MTLKASGTRAHKPDNSVQATGDIAPTSTNTGRKNTAKAASKPAEPLQEPLLEVANTANHLSACVEEAMQKYLNAIDDEDVTNIYEMVLAEVEKPLLTTVMKHVGNNQSRATRMLGLNRGTLRKKLQQYKLI